jgi:serine/threonine protein kinase
MVTSRCECITETTTFELEQRLSIVVDVADALDYLHKDYDPPVVHRDLKPVKSMKVHLL